MRSRLMSSPGPPVLIALAASAALLTACGGSGSDGGAATPTPSATPRGTKAAGTSGTSAQPGSIVFRRWSDTAHTHGAIFTIAPDGTHERQLTKPTTAFSDDYPDFAADGSLIAFQQCGALPPHTCRIFTVRPDGSDLRRAGGCRPGEPPPRCANMSYPA